MELFHDQPFFTSARVFTKNAGELLNVGIYSKLAVSKFANLDASCSYRFASWCKAKKASLVGAGHRVGKRDIIGISNHLLHADLQVGKGSAKFRKELPNALQSGNLAWGGIVVYGSGRNDFLECLKIAAIDSCVETFQGSDIAFTGRVSTSLSFSVCSISHRDLEKSPLPSTNAQGER